MLTYRTKVREVSLVAGRWSWTWLFMSKNLLLTILYTFLPHEKVPRFVCEGLFIYIQPFREDVMPEI
ncbi:hypothetical protein CIL03_04295 [Virgibacillus indicus]|uniref:Uncharacterized protein n=1 Tax=Virgibacillus indicus TaxID=2024554 RepID=A0A265NEE8_9BACI|nr:hypothetical protein CIL03_04295 [Virgibacillus indicus]